MSRGPRARARRWLRSLLQEGGWAGGVWCGVVVWGRGKQARCFYQHRICHPSMPLCCKQVQRSCVYTADEQHAVARTAVGMSAGGWPGAGLPPPAAHHPSSARGRRSERLAVRPASEACVLARRAAVKWQAGRQGVAPRRRRRQGQRSQGRHGSAALCDRYYCTAKGVRLPPCAVRTSAAVASSSAWSGPRPIHSISQFG